MVRQERPERHRAKENLAGFWRVFFFKEKLVFHIAPKSMQSPLPSGGVGAE